MTYTITATSYAGTLEMLGLRTGHSSSSAAMAALAQVSGLVGLVCKRGADGEYYVYDDVDTMSADDDDSAALAVIELEVFT